MLPLIVWLLIGQSPAWKEFSIGPAMHRASSESTDVSHGVLRASSISLKSLVAIATAMPPARIICSERVDDERYAVTAVLSDESRLRLRTRAADDAPVAAEFRSLLMQELVARFHLEYHRENIDRPVFTLQPAEAGRLKARRSMAGERGRIDRSGTPITNSATTIDARDVTFRRFCDWLQSYLKTPVMPDPSLPDGAWSFRLKWQTANQQSLFVALKTQIGVELVEEARNQVYLVVDRAERPDAR